MQNKSERSRAPRLTLHCLLAALALSIEQRAQAESAVLLADAADLAELSIESLMDINVYSVSKKSEPWGESAAAIYVLTADDIRNAGVQTLPEALRLIPGVTVARIDAHSWAVTTRGFNSTLSDKLEVLMDGRTLYTPLFSGVFWQRHNIPMNNIERIEVIRGPGGALWGANAVNGVINIVTRSASEMPSASVALGGGSALEHHASASGKLDFNRGAMQVYARDDSIADLDDKGGEQAQDGYQSQRIGFRSDWTLSSRDTLTVQGESYNDSINRSGTDRDEANRVNYVLTNWQRMDSEHASTEFKFIFEDSRYNVPGTFVEDRQTWDIELKKNIKLNARHEIVAGLSYHRTSDEIESPDLNSLGFSPDSRTDQTVGVYFQDQYDWIPDKLRLTVGAKAENNDYSGAEFQPTARISFFATPQATFWGAISRAVRIPNRLDDDIQFFAPEPAPPSSVTLTGSERFESEKVTAFELGYRAQLSDSLTLDVAGYYNQYTSLRGLDLSVSPATISNEGEGDSRGVESLIQWRPSVNWVHRISYVYQNIDFHAKSGSSDTSIASANESDPRHQVLLHTTWNMHQRLTLDGRLRFVSELKDPGVKSYTELDLSLRWRAGDRLTFTLLGQNLLSEEHVEFSGSALPISVPRSALLTVEWSL